MSHGRCLLLPCHASLNTVPTHHMSSCIWLFSNRWQKSWEEENALLCDTLFFWYIGFCSCQSKDCFSIYDYKCIWGKSLWQLSIPLIVYFNTNVIVLIFLNPRKWGIARGAFSLWSSVGNEVLSQWRFRSHLELQSVSSTFCFSGRRMEYLISLFSIGLFISCNEGKFINIVFSIQKNGTYHDCFTYCIYILYLSHHSAIIHLCWEVKFLYWVTVISLNSWKQFSLLKEIAFTSSRTVLRQFHQIQVTG